MPNNSDLYFHKCHEYLNFSNNVERVTDKCTVVQKKKKKGNTLIYFNANYRREMKLVIPIIMDYCLL